MAVVVVIHYYRYATGDDPPFRGERCPRQAWTVWNSGNEQTNKHTNTHKKHKKN